MKVDTMSRFSKTLSRRHFIRLCIQGLACAGLMLVGSRLRAEPNTSPTAPVTLSVAAASDLKFALDDVIAAYRTHHPSVTINVTYGSSGNFFAQIGNGAPFDLFFSADVMYPQQLAEKGLVLDGSQFQYAEGRLVLWVPTASKLDVQGKGLNALLDPQVNKVAIANPAHAPYGRAAEAALKSLGMYDKVKDKLVTGDNIAQTAQFVQSGAADAGLIALSLALGGPMVNAGRYWLVPETAHPKLVQVACILKRTAVLSAAQDFAEFVKGGAGRLVLKRYGFLLPGEK